MKKLLVLGILLVAALAVADLLAQAYVEDQVEASAESELEGIGGVQSEISSFPFLGRIAFGGEVSHLELVLTDVVGRGIPVAELRLDIDGLRFDRGTLLESNRLRITGVGRVAVVAVVTRDELAEVLGDAARSVELIEGTTLTVRDGAIGLPGGFSLPLPSSELIPCDASATIDDEEVVLRCESDRLPTIIVEAVGSVDLREQLGG
ncbi:MAG: LmeA family phospholipid-binding protein [Acidimicrobiia bacterium]|nr:LmeA family phospholipid-binding protein [Acidimicrobiia bacterium]